MQVAHSTAPRRAGRAATDVPGPYATIEVDTSGVRFGTAAADAVFVPEPATRAAPWLRVSRLQSEDGLQPDTPALRAAWADLLWAAQDFVSHGQGQYSMLTDEHSGAGGTRYFVAPYADDLQETAPAGGKDLEVAWRDMLPADVPGPTLFEFTRATCQPDACLAALAAILDCISVDQEPDPNADIGSRRIAVALAQRASQWNAYLDHASTEWADSAAVGKALGSRSIAAGRQRAARLRERNEILGVWVPSARAFYHPPFQFLPDGCRHPRLPDLMDALAAIVHIDHDDDAWGWTQLKWLTAPRVELSKARLAQPTDEPSPATPDTPDPRSPEEVFQRHPEAVIALAVRDATSRQDNNHAQDPTAQPGAPP